MIRKIFLFFFPFLIGIIFWHFISLYLPEKINNQIWNLTSYTYKVLRLKDMTQPPQYNSINDLPIDECPDYKEAVTIYETWLEKFGSKPDDSKMFIPFSTNDGSSNELNGIVKWRYLKDQPYFGLNAVGEWEHFIGNVNIAKLILSAEKDLVKMLESGGFKLHLPMNIPFYRYPDGLGAKKIGFIKNNSAYLFGLFEFSKEDFKSRFENAGFSYDLKHIDKPLVARVSCSKIDSVVEARFIKFIELQHTFSNETVVYVEDMKNGLLRFGLIYPGGSMDYLEHQFVYEKDGKMIKLQTTSEFPLCSVFEKFKVGKDNICFRPELKEFSVVKY